MEKRLNLNKNKKRAKKANKAQVTVFIILGIAILAVLFLLFFRERIPFIATAKTPIDKVQTCIESSITDAVDKISLQGGDINPQFYYEYQGNKISYLCYTEEYYKTCIMQRPMLRNHIQNQIEEAIKPTVESCLDSLNELKAQGYEVTMSGKSFDVQIEPKNILVNINTTLDIRKGETVESYNNFKVSTNSNLYDLIMISSSILNWEARYGDSETTMYMTYYPSIKVEKLKQGEGTTVYIITDRQSADKFMFSSKSLNWPPGYVA